jgi:hypothetical protein
MGIMTFFETCDGNVYIQELSGKSHLIITKSINNYKVIQTLFYHNPIF